MSRFVVANDRSGKPTWWLYAANNELVAWAGETFASTYNAQRAAAFKAGARTARYDVYLDTGGVYRWRAWRGFDKVASSGESFTNRGPPRQPPTTFATALVSPQDSLPSGS